jgi:hypothetical protein
VVYHAIQDPNESATPEEIAAMDAEIATLRTEITDLKAAEKTLKAELTTLNATMSTYEMVTAFQINNLDIQEIEERLGPLRAGDVKPVSKEEKERVETEWRLWSRRAATRKKIALDVWGLVCEELPEGKTKDELWVSFSIRTWSEGDSVLTMGARKSLVWKEMFESLTIRARSARLLCWELRRLYGFEAMACAKVMRCTHYGLRLATQDNLF